MADVSKISFDDGADYNVKDIKSRFPQWEDSDPSESDIPEQGEYIGTSFKKIATKLDNLGNFAYRNDITNAEILNALDFTPVDVNSFEEKIENLQENFPEWC